MTNQEPIPYEHAAICEARGLDPAKTWIAIDEDGSVCAYDGKPERQSFGSQGAWSHNKQGWMKISGGPVVAEIDTAGIAWQDSLLCPPKPEIVPEVGKWYRVCNHRTGEVVEPARMGGDKANYWDMSRPDGMAVCLSADCWTPTAELEISFTEKGAE